MPESVFVKCIMEFLMSMVPVAELRFALPWAVHNDIEPVLAYVIAVLGNMAPDLLYCFLLNRSLTVSKNTSGGRER